MSGTVRPAGLRLQQQRKVLGRRLAVGTVALLGIMAGGILWTIHGVGARHDTGTIGAGTSGTAPAGPAPQPVVNPTPMTADAYALCLIRANAPRRVSDTAPPVPACPTVETGPYRSDDGSVTGAGLGRLGGNGGLRRKGP